MQAHAYISQAVILRKELQPGTYHYVLGLGDFHDAIVPEDEKHRKTVKKWLAQAPRGMRVITEDLCSLNARSKGCLSSSKNDFLSGITRTCADVGADVFNAEYRYLRLTCFNSRVHAKKQSSQYQLLQKITMRELIQEVEDELAEIAKFSDGPILDVWYQTEIERIQAALKYYGWYRCADETVKLYRKQNKRFALKELILFDKTVLDMKIVHDIVNAAGKPVCIIAGLSHIERVEDRLIRIGYEPVHRIRSDWSLLGGIFSLLSGANSAMPNPVKPARLESFLTTFSTDSNN